MNWRRISEWCIACDSWRIFKYGAGYELWEWPRYINRYATADEARAMANELSRKAA